MWLEELDSEIAKALSYTPSLDAEMPKIDVSWKDDQLTLHMTHMTPVLRALVHAKADDIFKALRGRLGEDIVIFLTIDGGARLLSLPKSYWTKMNGITIDGDDENEQGGEKHE